ncbi:MAG: SURF1 family protein [Sphingomonadales bacterium]
MTPNLEKPPSRSLIVPAITTAIAVAILFALGTWQVQRLSWKQDLLAMIKARLHAPATELPLGGMVADEWRYRKVRLSGTFLHDQELHVMARRPGKRFGYHVFTPLERADGSLILINRGWVPADGKDAETRQSGQIAGPVAITGIVRKPWGKTWFLPENDPAANLWFSPDLDAMARHLGRAVAPVFVEADATPNPGGLPVGGQTRLEIPNDHLGYAITWYLLALAAVAIFLVYRRQQMKR